MRILALGISGILNSVELVNMSLNPEAGWPFCRAHRFSAEIYSNSILKQKVFAKMKVPLISAVHLFNFQLTALTLHLLTYKSWLV
jgi:hypothetical protein